MTTDTARPMAVSIRPARESDADDVVQLTTQLGYDVDAGLLRERLQGILSRSDQRFLVAVLEDRAVGWLHVAPLKELVPRVARDA